MIIITWTFDGKSGKVLKEILRKRKGLERRRFVRYIKLFWDQYMITYDRVTSGRIYMSPTHSRLLSLDFHPSCLLDFVSHLSQI